MTSRSLAGGLLPILALAALLPACAPKKPSATPAFSELPPMRTVEIERLQVLAAERANLPAAETYRIGPGDLLEISVFDIPELNRKERVAASGFIRLPLIGAVKAAGYSEAELAIVIGRRLAKNFVNDPQVNVFIAEYKSQQVAVTGAVQRPGLYPLPRDRRTILDMIAEAGGLTKESGGVIELIPAESGTHSPAFDAASVGVQLPGAGPVEGAGEALNQNAIAINLNELLRGAAGGTMNVPAMAGDVIFVPEVGSFTIEGWVDKPGTYPLTRQTTVLAAISAGGGSLMPARMNRVEVLRSRGGAEATREVQTVDLDAVRAGTARDIPLRSGDIVRVPANPLYVPPWAVYRAFQDLIRVGANLPMF